ncbi:hypothetical protein [Streptomyces sp. NPDC085937]|uniref:hypothetical protein n=1 Tax=Streptomyces sp. NPDC085937 TaxID=3365742 RepID=UPI0037D0E9A0
MTTGRSSTSGWPSRGYDISSDEYQAPSALAAIFAHNGVRKPKPTGDVGPGWFPYGSGKIPGGWSGPDMTRKYRKDANKPGFVWRAPKGQDSVRIDKGDPNSAHATQQVDHVVINSGGRTVGRNGVLLPPNARIQDYPVEAHVPLSEWQTWRSWNAP